MYFKLMALSAGQQRKDWYKKPLHGAIVLLIFRGQG